MNNQEVKYDEKMVIMLKEAFMKTYYALTSEHNEKFYYMVLILDEGIHPYFSAWSYEALEKSIKEQGISDEDRTWWKWDYSDSPYVTYGYDEYFEELVQYLDQRSCDMSDDELYDIEWYVILESMVEALREIREENAEVDEFSEMIINVEVAPPDCEEASRAQILNKPSALLDEYLAECEDE